jgi:hypothetical protein
MKLDIEMYSFCSYKTKDEQFEIQESEIYVTSKSI